MVFINLFEYKLIQKCADDQVSSWPSDRSVQAQYANIGNRLNSGVCNAFGLIYCSYVTHSAGKRVVNKKAFKYYMVLLDDSCVVRDMCDEFILQK